MEEIEDDPAVSSPLVVKYKQLVMGTPCKMMHGVVLVMTILLLAATVMDRHNIHTVWYHMLEFAVMVLFIGEVAASMYFLTPKVYMADCYNQVECFICILCTLNYLGVIFHVLSESNEKEEHEVILALRYFAQLLRLSMFVRVAYAESKISVKPIEIRPQLFTKEDSDEESEMVDNTTAIGSSRAPVLPTAAGSGSVKGRASPTTEVRRSSTIQPS